MRDCQGLAYCSWFPPSWNVNGPLQGVDTACQNSVDLYKRLQRLGHRNLQVVLMSGGRGAACVQERWNAESGPPQTRGSSLRFCNFYYPTAAYHSGVRVVCVTGRVRNHVACSSVKGLRDSGGQKERGKKEGQDGERTRVQPHFTRYAYCCGHSRGEQRSIRPH